MKLMVCVKQVPEIPLVSVDAQKGELSLPQGPGMINPFDSYGIEEALRLKEKNGGTITAISLGGKESDYALREALALGVDDAVHLMDDAFAGADAIATARLLAAGIRKCGDFDLVFLGKQAVDSDASTIPAAIGGFLGLPAVMFVRRIEAIGDGKITVERMTDDGFDKVTVPIPAVISVVKEINEPRLPSLKGKMMAKKKEIIVYNAAALGVGAGAPELTSVSHVAHVTNPPSRPKGEMITGSSPEEIADKLFTKLRDQQVL
ncbi:MAG: electron transfer flavoprotein subunit beta/FixA family protein [Candidatus Zixiibacteriota bacterium]|nr:MAG: electron transfer flavoprotein subunit beta/FixA family protein [candidate division Zixibacteria bacterium]